MSERRLATLEDQATKKSDLYKVNDMVSGFIVSKILGDKVILQKGGESIDVNLRVDKKIKQSVRDQARRRSVRKAPAQRSRTGRVRRRMAQRRRPPARAGSAR